jgi:hypothetical protein
MIKIDLRSWHLRWALVGWLAAGLVSAQAVCATCEDLEIKEQVTHPCTTSVVNVTRSDPGDCTLNPAPNCVPHVNCLFSATVTIRDLNCGNPYSSQFCAGLVNQFGVPVGVPICGSNVPMSPQPTPTSDPITITDWPIACGQKHELKFFRHEAGGALVPVAAVGGTCKACPVPPGGG